MTPSGRRLPTVLFLAAAAALAGAAASAQVYHWTDERGVEHFADHPPLKPPAGSPAVELRTAPSAGGLVEGAPPPPQGVADPADSELYPRYRPEPVPEVELFVTKWSLDSWRARAFLDEKGVPYVLHDVAENAPARFRWRTLVRGPVLPVAVIGDRVIGGFLPSAYEQALFAAGWKGP